MTDRRYLKTPKTIARHLRQARQKLSINAMPNAIPIPASGAVTSVTTHASQHYPLGGDALLLDEDNMASDLATKGASQQSIKKFVEDKISDAAYAAGWDGVGTIAPSKHAVYDKIQTVAAGMVTNGDTHDHSGGDGAQINHTTLANIGTNTHAQIDTALATIPSKVLYNALYNCLTDAIGADPAGFTVTEGAGCTVQVLNSIGNNAKVIELHDNGAGQAVLGQTFAAQASGTVEFYIRVAQTNVVWYLTLKEGTTIIVYSDCDVTGQWRGYNNDVYKDIINPIVANTDYHIRITFDNDSAQIWVNGVDKGTFTHFLARTLSTGMTLWQLETSGAEAYLYAWALDYSWATGYYTNRNKEGYYYKLP